MLEASGGRLRVMTVAPELPGMEAFIRQATQRGVAIMLGHTAAGSGDVRRAALAGARGMTHLYNACLLYTSTAACPSRRICLGKRLCPEDLSGIPNGSFFLA